MSVRAAALKQSSDTLPQKLRRLVHDSGGPLTRELLLNPSAFGLPGRVDSQKPDALLKSICGYCSTGCSLAIHMQDGEAVSLSPDTDYPVNLGMACPKGWQALDVLDSPDRATVPLFRRQKSEKLEATTWENALQMFCDQFRTIQENYGSESVAFLSTGQIPTEEMAFLGSLAKFGMGMRHGDGNTRQCMATSVVAYKESFGFDAPPFTYADFEESDVLVFIGANPCIAHPILWERVTRNRHRPEIVVIDPRLTETAMQATLHLPLKPKGDLLLLYGLSRELIRNNWIDRDFIAHHTNGFEEYSGFVEKFTPDLVEAATGISAALQSRLAEIIHGGKRVSFWWTMGVNQSHEGVRTAQAIINAALITGSIGRPGTGANSITGQCNAMGSRLFSNTTNLLGGYDFENAAHRLAVAETLRIPEDRIPRQGSWAYSEIIEGIRSGAIRGLWIVATNTAHSWINQNDVRQLLGKLDFLVVQDMYSSTETAALADLVLPAAGWGEKEGTFINSERRIGVVRAVKKAPGQSLSDFRIFRLIAESWGCGELFRDWTSPEAVFEKIRQLTADRPCDFTGIADYRMLDELGGIQWPCTPEDAEDLRHSTAVSSRPFSPSLGEKVADRPDEAVVPGFNSQQKELQERKPAHPDRVARFGGEGTHAGERRLFSDGRFYHPDGRARFVFESPQPVAEPTDDQYPLVLMTGRGTASQWHTQTRTSKSAILRTLYPDAAYLEISSEDAASRHISDGELLEVASRRGCILLRAVITPTVKPGQVFAPMHYPAVNQLTHPAFDPWSRQPSYKACAVRVSIAGGHRQ